MLQDMFSGATESSSSTIDWAMVELMRNPRVMAKAQAEVRRDMEVASYLKNTKQPGTR